MIPKDCKSLSITLTENEWIQIDSLVALSGKESLSSFLKGEIAKLKARHIKSPTDITAAGGIRIKKRPYIPDHAHTDLRQLGLRLKIHPSEVVTELIVKPLLRNS